MSGALDTLELSQAAVRAPNRLIAARWLARTFLEARFQDQATTQVDACARLTGIAREEPHPLALFAACSVDGILSADVGSRSAPARLERAIGCFVADLDTKQGERTDPLWIELMGQVRICLGDEREVPGLVRSILGRRTVGPAARQRLECLLATAHLRAGHPALAAAALTEAAVPAGSVDPARCRWAEQLLGSLDAAQPGPPGLSTEELRVLAGLQEGLSDPQIAHRLGLSVRAVSFYRNGIEGVMTARHRAG